MKRVLSVLLVVCMLFCLASCKRVSQLDAEIDSYKKTSKYGKYYAAEGLKIIESYFNGQISKDTAHTMLDSYYTNLKIEDQELDTEKKYPGDLGMQMVLLLLSTDFLLAKSKGIELTRDTEMDINIMQLKLGAGQEVDVKLLRDLMLRTYGDLYNEDK